VSASNEKERLTPDAPPVTRPTPFMELLEIVIVCWW
jgi:hypothetical protein